ncbi:MAG TPA: BatA domain-containing protein [Tepidisphaeraceae bacterium]|nr:BatA domain-containing protein [Tepidisphaeraceae bacterium]
MTGMFLNAIMLVGLGAAVVPLVLHLLSRARYRDVEWGAMMFLDGADARQRHSSRLTQWLLLLVRAAMIALLAIALARPVLRHGGGGAGAPGRVTAALLLDCSGSMGYDENGRTRFQMAQAAARQVLRGLRAGDRVSLILMGVSQNPADLEPTGDLRAVEARINDAKPGYGSADLRDALDRAADVVDRYEKSNRDVYVICDRQALSWNKVDEHFAAQWKRRMYVPGISTRMFVMPVGNSDADNVAVESIKVLNGPAIINQPVDVEVVLRNYGPIPRAAVPLTLENPGQAAAQRTVSLEAGKSVSVVFTLTLDRGGSRVLTARLKGTGGYAGDDELQCAVQVIDPIRVLIVSGDEHAGSFEGGSDFLKWALAPHQSAGVPGHDPCAVTVLPAENWAGADFDKYQVVVLANVERFTPREAHDIEKYVYAGGRLLVAPGSLSRIDDYNALLYKDGAGVLPAMLMAPTAADGSEATTILGLQTEHPVFGFLRGHFEIPTATIARYFPAVPRQVGADVLARYLSDDPFLIDGQSEAGRVLLMTTSLDADWTTLPLSNFYLPFVQSAVKYLASGAVPNGNLKPGGAIKLSFDNPNISRTVTLTPPGGQPRKLELINLDQQAQIQFSDTDRPGEYRVRVEEPGKPAVTHYFIVPPPRDESDLTQLHEDRWHWLEGALGFKRIDPANGAVRETLAAGRDGRELWGAALAALFGLFVLEMLIAGAGSVELP